MSVTGAVTVSAQISDDVIGGWSPRCREVLEKLHDHFKGFTRFIRLHTGHSLHKTAGQRTAPRERNSPDPVLVQQWITQVQAEKAVAEADLRRITGRRIMTADEINTLVEAMAGIAAILRRADPSDKAEVYRQLGIKLTYKPGLRLIQAEASPNGSCTKMCPEGNTDQCPTYPIYHHSTAVAVTEAVRENFTRTASRWTRT